MAYTHTTQQTVNEGIPIRKPVVSGAGITKVKMVERVHNAGIVQRVAASRVPSVGST